MFYVTSSGGYAATYDLMIDAVRDAKHLAKTEKPYATVWRGGRRVFTITKEQAFELSAQGWPRGTRR